MQGKQGPALISFARTGGIAVAGIMFALGWWMMLDGIITHESPKHVIPWYGYIPAFSASVGVAMLNMVSLDDMDGGGGNGVGGFFMAMPSPARRSVALKISLWLALWSLVLFGSWAGAISVMAVLSQKWNGISLLLQPFFCIASAFLMLVCRKAPPREEMF